MNKNFIFLAFFFVFFIFLINFSSALENLTAEEKASSCLLESQNILNEMQNQDFSNQRISDTLKQMQSLYDAQISYKEKGKSYDFSLVLPYCEEVKKIKSDAFIAKDALDALNKFYQDSITKDIDTSYIDSIILEINQEIKSERYEKVPDLVDKAYTEIIKVKSSQTTLNLFYSTTGRGLKKFFLDNWLFLTITFIILLVFYIIYRKAISKWIVNKKIEKLNLRKKTLKNMVMDTQREYFNKGDISESTFRIRTKKLAELIRDIDRQIPLLQEDLMKLEKK